MYNAPPLLKEKLPRLPWRGVANHKPPILGLTHGPPGSAGFRGFRRVRRVPPGSPGSPGSAGFRRVRRVPPGPPGSAPPPAPPPIPRLARLAPLREHHNQHCSLPSCLSAASVSVGKNPPHSRDGVLGQNYILHQHQWRGEAVPELRIGLGALLSSEIFS